jgi:hypothetical protein
VRGRCVECSPCALRLSGVSVVGLTSVERGKAVTSSISFDAVEERVGVGDEGETVCLTDERGGGQ